ncbi:MAG: hypothetical protein GWP41_09650, partial [Planctomycetia bacterium]|nr:hypothetical protein [Planctomycetia bacterium]
MKVKDLALAIGGTVELGPMEDVQQVQSPENAQPGDLTWIGDAKFAHQAIHATALLLGEDQAIPEQSHHQSVIRHPHPHAAFALSLQTLQPDPEPECSGISPEAHVSPEASIAADVSIGPGCVIGAQVVVGKGSRIAPGVVVAGPAHIGESVIIHPRVVIQSHSKIGNGCILQPGCVIGGDGFGYAPSPTGALKIPHR